MFNQNTEESGMSFYFQQVLVTDQLSLVEHRLCPPVSSWIWRPELGIIAVKKVGVVGLRLVWPAFYKNIV